MPAKAPNSAVAAHGRSLSIMSLGSDKASEGRGPSIGNAAKRPGKPHARSASLQLLPMPRPQFTSPHVGAISPRQPSPLYESSTPPALAEGQNEPLPIRPARRRPGTTSASNTPQLGRQNSLQRNPPSSGAFDQSFQFPAPQLETEPPKPRRSPSNMHSGQHRPISPRPPDGWTGALSNLNPISRVMSENSTAGTPRSSSEFYSMSNRSDETLTSETPHQNPNQQNGSRLLPKPAHSQQASRKGGSPGPAEPETLMMAYAQTMGYFILDGSLVNAAPFEEVKRKGVQGGGGVIGVERSKRVSGMFGAFSWGNIGESLGGLLGGDEMSSMAQMKATVGSKSIPLLSTPQNLLFVDLRLAPGESRSFHYQFSLPRGLPPSYRGRAIKVSYHLALGVQRPKGQAVKHVEIPLRVLGSYNARGETLGHDLMSPYILLQDTARSTGLAPDDASSPLEFPKFPSKDTTKQPRAPKQGLEDFLRYTERLLSQPKDAHDALISPTTSPTTPTASRKQSLADQSPASIKESIDLAILRANHPAGAEHHSSTNRFNIARAGQPVAVLTLLRPAYRLGEAVTGTIDFTAPASSSSSSSSSSPLPPQSPTFSVVVALESFERVDASLALRSSTSIHRVTRKVHAAVRENTLFARRVRFSLAVPATGTPSFETTGVSLGWRVRVEFTTQRLPVRLGGEKAGGPPPPPTAAAAAEVNGEDFGGLLEEIGRDERGRTLIARERLDAEAFEIEVPVRVYGVPGVEGMGEGVEGVEV